jgi:hypothetical protein
LLQQACHICGKEAVGRCFTCGNLFCQAHGDTNCLRCETGIVEGDYRADRVTTRPWSDNVRAGWWRPQIAEDFEPPACYICRGLTRFVCRNCHSLYCREHAGVSGLCIRCYRSSRLGLYIFLGMLLLIVALALLGLSAN